MVRNPLDAGRQPINELLVKVPDRGRRTAVTVNRDDVAVRASGCARGEERGPVGSREGL